MRRPAIIALVGIDGSGKTTQAKMLAEWLTGSGAPATYWQNAGGRRVFGRLARRFGRPDAQALLGRTLMLTIEAWLRWLAIARALVRSRLTGRVAVMDRYAVCQQVSVRAHGARGSAVGRYTYRLFPRPELTVLLDIAPQTAYERIERRGTDHERYAFLAAGAAAYAELPVASPGQPVATARPDPVVRIDGGRSFGEVHADLRAAVREALVPPVANISPPSA